MKNSTAVVSDHDIHDIGCTRDRVRSGIQGKMDLEEVPHLIQSSRYSS